MWGFANPVNVWAYSHVTEADAERLRKAEMRSDLVDILREVTAGRGVVVALAEETRGILITAALEPGVTYGDPADRPVEALNDQIDAVLSARHAVEADDTRLESVG
jgi:hypothetical protein